MDVTLILPIHNECQNIAPLLEEIERAMDATHREEYEVIAVDDGSTDGSRNALMDWAARKPYLRVIQFRRNYGQSAAFDAGFRHALGRVVVTLDADGQNDPADIPHMVELIEHQGYDFVAGYRENRQDKLLLRKIPSRLANMLIRGVTKTKLRDLGCSLKAYRHEITDELRLYGEMHRFIGVMAESLAGRTIEIPVHHRARQAGKSNYGIMRTFKVLLDLVTVWFMRGYETKPIYVFGGAGLALGFAGVLLSVLVLYQKFVNGVFVHRNPLFIISMIFSVMAVQFLVLGLLAEIIVRTYFESRGKSSYLIARMVGFDPPKPVLTHLVNAASNVKAVAH